MGKKKGQVDAKKAAKKAAKKEQKKAAKVALRQVLNPKDNSDSSQNESRSPTPPCTPPPETIFTIYPELKLLIRYHADCQSLGCKEGSRISARWLRMKETERVTIIDDALRAILKLHIGEDVPIPNSKRTFIQEILSDKRAFSGDRNPIHDLDIIPYLFSCFTSNSLAANPQDFLRLAHARTLHHPRVYSRTDFVRVVEPMLSVFYKLSRSTDFLADDDQPSTGKQRTMVVLSTWACDVEENLFWGTLMKLPSDHFRFKAEAATQTVAHPYDALWVLGYQMVVMGFIKEVMLRILRLESYDSATEKKEGEEEEEKDIRYYEDTLQNLLIGLPPLEDVAVALRTSSPTYGPIFNKEAITEVALACCRHATDHLYLLMTDPTQMAQAINDRLEFRFEHVADVKGNRHGDVRSREGVNDCIAHVIWHTATRAVMWNRVCCALEEINLRKFQDEKDDALLCSIRHILEDLVDYALDDIRRYMMCGPVLRRFFYVLPEKPRLWRQLAHPADLYPLDPINGLLLCLSSIFESRKELDWVHKVLDVRFVISEIELHLKRDPNLEKSVPGFIMGFLSEVAAAFQLMDMLELHRPDTWPDEQFPTVALAGKLKSLCSVLQSRLGAVDLTAILRDGDSMTNLEDYVMPKDGDGVRRPNLKNYKKFWKLHNMKLKKECGFTIEMWFQKCGDGLVFERSRGYWHGKNGCWKGEGLDAGSSPLTADDPNNFNNEAHTLGYQLYGEMDVEAREEELIENQFEAFLALPDMDGGYDSDSDYDEDLRWPGLPSRSELKANNPKAREGSANNVSRREETTAASPASPPHNASTILTTAGDDGMPILFSDEEYWSDDERTDSPSSYSSASWTALPLDTEEAWTDKHHPELFAWDQQCKPDWIKELECRLIAEKTIEFPLEEEKESPLGYNLSHEVIYGELVEIGEDGDVLEVPVTRKDDLPHPHIRFASMTGLDKWLDEQPDGLMPENMWLHQDDPLVVEYIAPQRRRVLTDITENIGAVRKPPGPTSTLNSEVLNGGPQETHNTDEKDAEIWSQDGKTSEINKKVLASIDSYPWIRPSTKSQIPILQDSLSSQKTSKKPTQIEAVNDDFAINSAQIGLNGRGSTPSAASISSEDTVIHHSVAETPNRTVPATPEQLTPRGITAPPLEQLDSNNDDDDDDVDFEPIYPDEPYPSELREAQHLRQTFIFVPPPTDKSEWPIVYLSLSGYEILKSLSSSKPVSWRDFVVTMNELGFKFSKIGGARHVMIPEMVVDERFVLDRPYITGIWSGDEAARVWKRLESAYGFDLELFWCEEFDERAEDMKGDGKGDGQRDRGVPNEKKDII